MTFNDLMTVREVADMMELSVPEVYALIATHQLSATVVGPVRVRRSNVTAYLARNHPTSAWDSHSRATGVPPATYAMTATQLADSVLAEQYLDARRRQRQAEADRAVLQSMEGQPDLAHLPIEGLPLTRREAFTCLGIGALASLITLGALALAYWWFR